MNETFKKFLVNNLWAIIVTLAGFVFFVSGYILSLRADINTTQFQVQALQQSTAPIQSIITEVAAIRATTDETKEKVNALYNFFLNNKEIK